MYFIIKKLGVIAITQLISARGKSRITSEKKIRIKKLYICINLSKVFTQNKLQRGIILYHSKPQIVKDLQT